MQSVTGIQVENSGTLHRILGVKHAAAMTLVSNQGRWDGFGTDPVSSSFITCVKKQSEAIAPL
jgi:hypothetical protein